MIKTIVLIIYFIYTKIRKFLIFVLFVQIVPPTKTKFFCLYGWINEYRENKTDHKHYFVTGPDVLISILKFDYNKGLYVFDMILKAYILRLLLLSLHSKHTNNKN